MIALHLKLLKVSLDEIRHKLQVEPFSN